MSTPIAGIIGTRASRELTQSALPWAPVVSDPNTAQPPASRRQSAALLLRFFASRTNRLADRLDPNCA
jgi:hypothetical protein